MDDHYLDGFLHVLAMAHMRNFFTNGYHEDAENGTEKVTVYNTRANMPREASCFLFFLGVQIDGDDGVMFEYPLIN